MYPYTADLICLSSCRPLCQFTIPDLRIVSTQLKVDAWELFLAAHPDKAYVGYVTQGLREGFRIGFKWESPLTSATCNMHSTRLRPAAISGYIADELSKGRMLGPFPLAWKAQVHINRFGLIPKGHNTGKYRLITDLSYPSGCSVNDGISPALTSLSYVTVDDIAKMAQQMGKGSLLAKMDIEAAYRLIPVHPQDRILQAVEWEGKLYVDPMLPFGLRSAPKIFNAVADALNWCLQKAGIRYIQHYLDDFIVVAPPQSGECKEAVETMDAVCRQLGVPMAPHKREGPTTCLVFLGIEIDTVAGELRLPAEKLSRLTTLLNKWGARKSCQRRELESLIGVLSHACKVVRPGRSFLRRLLDLLHATGTRRGNKCIIRLNRSCQADIAWWREFVGPWNGVSFLCPTQELPTVEVTSDASGSWGCGAWHLSEWCQVPWDSRADSLSIAAKELVPIILACAIWGQAWHGHRVHCRCDNQVVVAALQSRASRDAGVMHLLRCLIFVEVQLGCHLFGSYIDTHANHLADDLSRDRAFSFLSKVPSASHTPTPVPPHLLDLLLNPQADWVSQEWRQRFSGTFRRAWRRPHVAHTTRQ